jgi:Mor family transcriptional regulator
MPQMSIRNLAALCAPRLAAKVESAVLASVKAELPGTIEAVLSEMYSGETVRFYVPAKPVTARRDRDTAIRIKWTGRNAKELSHEFKLSPRTIFRIATGHR